MRGTAPRLYRNTVIFLAADKIRLQDLNEAARKILLGVPRDIANLIAFLCSDEASFISGQVIYVAGGPRG